MAKCWFTADLHLDHENIIKYCNRPFLDVQDMNYHLIDNWNQRVKKEDIVFHIGDFCYKETKHKAKDFIDQLNGQIIFIKGNHDTNNGVKTNILDLRLVFGKKNARDILLIHRPEEAGPGYFLVLSGHVHQLWKFQTIKFYDYSYDCCNVGVDMWSYYPITINEIMRAYSIWKKKDLNNLIED